MPQLNPFSPSRKKLALLILSTLSGPLLAAELQLDPVVVTGSRSEHKSFDLPAAIDVIDSERIDAGQAKINVSEALSAIPGITALNRQNYAQDLQISSRGFGARSAFGVRGIKLIADGIPASTPDGQGQAATFNLDTAERIEVLRGPSSVLYGNNAGGVVQLFSRTPNRIPALNGGIGAGSYGSLKVDAGAEGWAGGVGYLLDTSRFTTDGYRDHSAATRDQSYAKLLVPVTEDSMITLVGNTMKQDNTQDPLGLDWSTANNAPRSVTANALLYNTRKSIDHKQGGATFEKALESGTFVLSAYSGTRHVIQYQSIPFSAQSNPKHSGGVIDFDRDFFGLGGRFTHKREFSGGVLTTTAGLDMDRSSDDRKGYENFIGSTLGVKGALRRNETDEVTSVDPYLQAEWKTGPWQLSGGMRHTRVNFRVKDSFLGNGDDSGTVSYSKTTPMAALLYQINPQVNLYASVARGFEAPTFNELFYSGPGGTFSFTLQPATSRHIETGIKALIGNSTRINAALFRINTDNEIVVDSTTGGRSSYKNAGRTQRSGLEFSLDTSWTGGLSGKVALTVLNATYEEAFLSNGTQVASGKKLPGIPDSSLFAELAWKSTQGFSAGLEAVGQGRIYVEDTNTRAAAPGYALVNLRVGLEQKSGPWHVKEFLRVNNLFNRQYIGSVIVGDSNNRYYEPAPGQNWLLGASLRYSY